MRNRAIRGCLIAFVFVAGMGDASASKKMHPKFSNDQTEIQSSDDKKQSSPQPPIVVNILPPEKTKDVIDQETQERAKKTELDRKLVKLTGDLANYTFDLFTATSALVITSAGLLWLGRKQSIDMKASIVAAEKSAKAAMKSAIVAESALVGTEAPFLFAIVEFPVLGIGDIPRVQIMGKASYTLRNYGRAPAIIREVYDGCILSAGLPAPIAFPPPQSPLMKVEIVAAGEASSPREPYNSVTFPNDTDSPREQTAFIVGQVRYEDVFGNQYISGFCYALNEISETFYAIGGTSYNYRRKLSDDEAREAEARDTPRTIPRKES